ncbi:MAG: conserved hypothetical nucleotide-binding protein [Deltaproteobacteria bacterium]|nr:conserved hypothetical nucleotide-binding protein [Deltaproteobacteria bacterium]
MHEEKAREESAEIVTRSPEETIQLGKELGELLRPGEVVALIGDLGAGKTTLAKGIAGRFPIYHADLYRLQDAMEVENLGWEEFIFGEGISLLEWAEKIPGILPEERIEIRIFWVGPGERRFLISGKGAQAKIILVLQRKWKKEE